MWLCEPGVVCRHWHVCMYSGTRDCGRDARGKPTVTQRRGDTKITLLGVTGSWRNSWNPGKSTGWQEEKAFLKTNPHPSDPAGVLFEAGDLGIPHSTQVSGTRSWQLGIRPTKPHNWLWVVRRVRFTRGWGSLPCDASRPAFLCAVAASFSLRALLRTLLP